MPWNKGSVLFEAAAGSGKTTLLTNLALKYRSDRVLFTTYTDENTEEIRSSFLRAARMPPSNIDLMPWFTFLLKHCVKPFLWHAGFGVDEVSGVLLVSQPSAPRTRLGSVEHYLTADRKVYTDKLAELALYIDEQMQGAVIDRLKRIYDFVFIDGAQDLSGYDLELLEEFLRSGMNLVLATDQRQATYHTNSSSKNGKYRELGLRRFLEDRKLLDLCPVDDRTLSGCHRCNQSILDVANSLYPAMGAANCIRKDREEDRALPPVHIVAKDDVEFYAKNWNPVALRYDVRTKVSGSFVIQNFGASKGRTYDRVLIFPTEGIRKWLQDKETELSTQTRAKLYVAITRAKYSVGFVGTRSFSEKTGLPLWERQPKP